MDIAHQSKESPRKKVILFFIFFCVTCFMLTFAMFVRQKQLKLFHQIKNAKNAIDSLDQKLLKLDNDLFESGILSVTPEYLIGLGASLDSISELSLISKKKSHKSAFVQNVNEADSSKQNWPSLISSETSEESLLPKLNLVDNGYFKRKKWISGQDNIRIINEEVIAFSNKYQKETSRFKEDKNPFPAKQSPSLSTSVGMNPYSRGQPQTIQMALATVATNYYELSGSNLLSTLLNESHDTVNVKFIKSIYNAYKDRQMNTSIKYVYTNNLWDRRRQSRYLKADTLLFVKNMSENLCNSIYDGTKNPFITNLTIFISPVNSPRTYDRIHFGYLFLKPINKDEQHVKKNFQVIFHEEVTEMLKDIFVTNQTLPLDSDISFGIHFYDSYKK